MVGKLQVYFLGDNLNLKEISKLLALQTLLQVGFTIREVLVVCEAL
jgi:hypothetical protein